LKNNNKKKAKKKILPEFPNQKNQKIFILESDTKNGIVGVVLLHNNN
jgi:hypothetical protein